MGHISHSLGVGHIFQLPPAEEGVILERGSHYCLEGQGNDFEFVSHNMIN